MISAEMISKVLSSESIDFRLVAWIFTISKFTSRLLSEKKTFKICMSIVSYKVDKAWLSVVPTSRIKAILNFGAG